LSDLHAREEELVGELAQNSAQLNPLEAAAAALSPKVTKVREINTKLQVAETGKLKEIAAFQSRLAAERDLAGALDEVRKVYDTGLTLGNFRRDYDAIAGDHSAITGDSQTAAILAEVKKAISEVNDFLDTEEKRINARFKQAGQTLRAHLQKLTARHQQLADDLKTKIVDLQKKGLSGSVAELNDLIKDRTSLSQQIATIRGQDAVLRELRTKREQLLGELASVRGEMSSRRKNQLKSINDNLKRTIEDYAVFLYYDSPGVIDEFLRFILSTMQGTYFQEDTARAFCARLSPGQLAGFARSNDLQSISAAGVGNDWARQILDRLRVLSNLHQLEVISVPEKPVFKIVTKTAPAKTLSIDQLSDGQKHTILLTIAMLAESNLPLIIDQPEDDLDNAFIFRSVVSTLRRIKERRQIIMVTHNANIAVLGDSELILPMRRSGDGGVVFELGSIDRNDTRKAVQDILEGGELAFRKRKEIYGH
jgi:DNA repair exonuclease SbcCD ATPase subunit